MVKLVQQYFSESARKFPNKPAVDTSRKDGELRKTEEEKMTFSELEEYSNQLARYLKGKGIIRGDRVAFMFMKIAAVDAIASLLAILKADAIYVPIHHSTPPERVAKIWNDAKPKLLICKSYSAKTLRNYAGPGFQFIETDIIKKNGEINKYSPKPIGYENRSDGNRSEDTAYIMYTSGSTGGPKGVEITHGNIINATDWAVKEFGINENDRMSQHPPFSFDLSTFDLYCAFKSGATLFPVEESLSLFPAELLEFIEDRKLTIWNSVPSVLVYLWNSGLVKPGRLTSLKKIFFNGEAFPTKFLIDWMKTFPDKEFINMYGPTETTVQCSFYRIPKAPTDLSRFVPIGKAQKGVEIFAVREDNSIAQVNEVGELLVGGLGVGKGYWDDEERTQAAFIEFPGKGRVYRTGDLARLLPDGNYEFIGRKDNQVKVHGNRIELGDVDVTMYSLPYVNEAAAIVVPETETGSNMLIAFVDLKSPQPETLIKSDLGKLLPPYMIPVKIIERKLPKTSTGKIDRPKLKAEYERCR